MKSLVGAISTSPDNARVARVGSGRHPIHRDGINHEVLEQARVAASITPLSLGPALIEVDTTQPAEVFAVAAAVHALLEG